MTTDAATRTDKERPRMSPQGEQPKTSIRYQVLVTVNSVLAVFILLLLVLDYRRDLTGRLDEKQSSLEEEASILLTAVIHLQHHGIPTVQQYIDTTCGQMQDDNSPGHHIAVRLPAVTLQATTHGRASRKMLASLERAAESPSRRAMFQGWEMIVGVASENGITLYVSETLAKVKMAARTAAMTRLAGLLAVSLIAAALINVILLRAVTNPIHRLVTNLQQIGDGHFAVLSESFQSAELDYLAGEIDRMKESLAVVERKRKSHLAKARAIQQHLLPRDVLTPGLGIAHLFHPADEIGGDYYDVLSLENDVWLICVADVTGHGIPAAMSSAMLKTLVWQAAQSHSSPAEMLGSINRRFAAVSLSDDFVSMMLLLFEPRTGQLLYASAGHEPAWLLSSGKKNRELPSTGLLLGIVERAKWEEESIELSIGDRLLILTDGVSETFDEQGEAFGRSRLSRLLIECQTRTIEQTVWQIEEELANHRGQAPQHDDVTVVLVELTALEGENRRA